jgi:hypothetical protein
VARDDHTSNFDKMERRRNGPQTIGSSPNDGDSTGTANGSGGGPYRKSFKLALFLCAFAGVYYYITVKEKASIMSFGAQSASSLSGKTVSKSDTTNVGGTDVIPAARLKDEATKEFILKPKHEFTPAIVWLMSFPNSGTSYTMTMVARSSGRAFATNYCDEVMAPDDEESLSIYPRRPEGPFWAGMSGKISTPRDLPDKYVLTKTHCGSRCLNCGPDDYVETPEYFLKRCASGHSRVAPRRRRVDVDYPPERVAKAIHLIRNPFHNIIARYHLEHRHHGYKNETGWLEKHGNDREGLKKYCRDLDRTYKKQDEEYFGKDKIPKAPCHGEFYKWTQWHNLAHEGLELIEAFHEVPAITVYYEDYSKKFNTTVARILEFLELEHVGVLREFSARSDYGGYFTKEQENEVRDLVKSVASKKTWNQVKHYFR